jgi:opacity protein-like surface antigen
MNTRTLALTLVALATAGCAPDAWQSYKATGFNEYLDTVQAKCQPYWIGNVPVSSFNAAAWQGQGGGFDQWLDATSRLYYSRMTPAQYRESIQALALTSSDARTNRSIDCTIAQLPAQRPTSPGGTPR